MDFSLSSSLVGSAVSNPDKLALDLQFALDKTITARKGPTPVFTRGSSATFIDSDGLVKYGPENLLLQSENFLSGWTTFGTSVQSVSSTNPFGGATSYKLTESAANAEHGIFRTSLITTGLATESIYAKEAGRRFCYLRSDATTLAVFDLIGGTVTQVSAGTTAFMTDAGNGWWRLTFTSQVTGNYVLKLSNVGTGVLASTSYLGNGTSGVLIWGAQLERFATSRVYNPTTTAVFYGPRFDHDPVTGVCKGLLMEESRTNLTWPSIYTTANSGVGIFPAGSVTITLNQPSIGTDANGAASVRETATTQVHGSYVSAPAPTQPVTISSGTVYTASIFVKADGRTKCRFSFNTGSNIDGIFAAFDLSSNGSIITNSTTYGTGASAAGISATITKHIDGWFRLSVSGSLSSTTSYVTVETLNDAGNRSFLGDITKGVYIANAQLEAGSFPTSYIPTTTASVVRSNDVCGITGSAFSGMWNPLEGTTLVSGDKTNSSNTTGSYFSYQSGATEVGPLMSRTSTLLLGRIRNNSALDLTNLDASQSPAGEKKLAVAWKATSDQADRDYCSDGVILTKSNPNTGTAANNQTTLTIGSRPSASVFNGTISSLRYYKKRLANTKLQALTV